MHRRHFNQLAITSLLAASTPSAHAFGAAPQASTTANVRFSFMLWALTQQAPFDRSLEIVSSAGYQGVELVGEFQKWTPQELQSKLAHIHTLGLVVDSMSGVKAGFAVPAQSGDFLKQLREHLDYAVQLHCPQIILLSGPRVEGLDPKSQRQTALDNLQRAADMAAKQQIEIVIEPIDPLENPTIYLSTVSDGFSIVREINRDNVKVLYDFYHEQRAYGNLIEKLENNIHWVGLVHIADVPGRHEPGTGEVNYSNIYRKLAALNYNRFIAMEYYPTGDPVASLSKSRQAALQALHSLS